MPALVLAMLLLPAGRSAFAQTTPEEFKTRYDRLVSSVGVAGLGVETLLAKWEKAFPDDPERRARFSAVFAIIAAIDAPISFMITRLIPSSIHPVVLRSDSGLSPDMLIPFLCGIFGMALVGFGIYRLRLRIEEQAAEVEQLKREFEQTVA